MKQSSLHVAIIMDGNGRWATLRELPRLAGHLAGADALRRVVEAAPSCAITTLTAYAFSCDNWKRPCEEVNGLMALLAGHLESETPRMRANGVRLSVIGRRDRLPSRLVDAIRHAEDATSGGTRLCFQLAVDYSARDAIVRAAQRASNQPVTLEVFGQLLGPGEPVDLLIRTGGEQRLSDFLLWESAYAELVFTNCMWPEFKPVDLRKALSDFHRRDRRFGTIGVTTDAEPPKTFTAVRERWLR